MFFERGIGMRRRVMGTFCSQESISEEIIRLQAEEAYRTEEFMIVTDENNKLETDNISRVAVKQVDSHDTESFWEKLKDAVTPGYATDDNDNPLEEYGVAEELSEHYLEVLQDGEYVLLADMEAPLDRVESGPTPQGYSKENLADNTEKNAANHINNTEEDVDMTEEKNRADERNEEKREINEVTEETTKKSEEDPDLTGEEKSVEGEKDKTEEPEVSSTGTSKLKVKDPLNAEHVEQVEDPSAKKKEQPEADANYSEEAEDAGIQSEQQDEEKNNE